MIIFTYQALGRVFLAAFDGGAMKWWTKTTPLHLPHPRGDVPPCRKMAGTGGIDHVTLRKRTRHALHCAVMAVH